MTQQQLLTQQTATLGCFPFPRINQQWLILISTIQESTVTFALWKFSLWITFALKLFLGSNLPLKSQFGFNFAPFLTVNPMLTVR